MPPQTALKQFVAAVRGALASRWGRLAKFSVATLVIGASLYSVGQRLVFGVDALDWSSVAVDWPILGQALAMALVSQFLGGVEWQLLLRGLGHRLPVATCLWIHTSSNLAKYIPGYAWQILGKAYLTHREQVPRKTIALALAADLSGTIATGLLLAALLARDWDSLLPWGLPSWSRTACGAVMASLLIAAPWLMAYLAPPRDQRQPKVQASFVWAAWLTLILAWAALGLSTSLIVQALAPAGQLFWRAGMVSIALSFVVSFAVFFVPAGLGVREATLSWLLGHSVGGGIAAMSAILSRLSLLLAELLAFGLLWTMRLLVKSYNQSITQRGEGKNSSSRDEEADSASE